MEPLRRPAVCAFQSPGCMETSVKTRQRLGILTMCAACLCLAALLTAVAMSGQTGLAPGSREIVPMPANWRFQIDVTDIGEKEQWYRRDFDRSHWSQVVVPKAWDLIDEALWGYEGIGWYTAIIPGTLARGDNVQRLKFGRVNYHSQGLAQRRITRRECQWVPALRIRHQRQTAARCRQWSGPARG